MVTVFYGDDTYRSRETYRAAREAASARAGVPVVILRDERLTPAALQAALGGENLFGARPPVAVERLTAFTGASAAAAVHVLQNAPKDASVLIWEEGIPAESGIVWRALQALADLQHVPVLSEPEVFTWMVQRAAASGRTMDAAAQRALVSRCGENLWSLASEIDKLVLASHAGSITVVDVEQITPLSPTAEIFAVVRAIVHGQAVEAFRSLTAGTLSGEDPRRIFFWVLRELAALLRVREGLDRGESPTAWELAREFHLPKSAAEHLLRTARQTNVSTLRALFDRGVVAYYHLNTGRAEVEEVLESLVLGGIQRAQA